MRGFLDGASVGDGMVTGWALVDKPPRLGSHMIYISHTLRKKKMCFQHIHTHLYSFYFSLVRNQFIRVVT